MQHFIDVGGRQYAVKRVGTSAHKATARVRDGVITIKIPVCWPREEGFKAALELERKVVAGLKTSPEKFERQLVAFRDGDEATVFGRHFKIAVQQGNGARTSSARFKDGVVEVTVAQGLDEFTKAKHVSNLARRVISRELLPEVERRVRELNDRHFGFALRKVFLKDNSSSLASCSEDGNVNLGFRLLFAPPECFDYLAVHELAHLKEKNHSPAFWALVEKAFRDHREKEQWLRENWGKLGTAASSQAASETGGGGTETAEGSSEKEDGENAAVGLADAGAEELGGA